MQQISYIITSQELEDSHLVESRLDNQELIIKSLNKSLEEGIATFWFKKSDGSIRKAVGTRCSNFIPKYQDKHIESLITESRDFLVGFETDTLIVGDNEKLNNAIKPFLSKEGGTSKTPNPDIIPYYDLVSKGWRSFRKDSLIATS